MFTGGGVRFHTCRGVRIQGRILHMIRHTYWYHRYTGVPRSPVRAYATIPALRCIRII